MLQLARIWTTEPEPLGKDL